MSITLDPDLIAQIEEIFGEGEEFEIAIKPMHWGFRWKAVKFVNSESVNTPIVWRVKRSISFKGFYFLFEGKRYNLYCTPTRLVKGSDLVLNHMSLKYDR